MVYFDNILLHDTLQWEDEFSLNDFTSDQICKEDLKTCNKKIYDSKLVLTKFCSELNESEIKDNCKYIL